MEGSRNYDEPAIGRRDIARLVLLGAVLSAIGIALGLLIDWFPAQASGEASDIDSLWDLLIIASVPIFVLVMTIAVYSVLKFRAAPGDKRDGAPIHGNTRLEIVWVTIPFLIVTALGVYGWIVLDDIEEQQRGEMVVDVTGQQFAWRFKYPDSGGIESSQLVLPKDKPVKFNIRTDDVIHSFWVPEFRLKQDAVRGLTTHVRLTPTKTGRWQIVCAELCGIGHATMRQVVRVVPPAEFDTWLADQREQG